MQSLTGYTAGRDSMIAYLLLEPVLSTGENSATEAVISAVLERINRTDGSVCHEETIGDYATYLNQQANLTSIEILPPYRAGLHPGPPPVVSGLDVRLDMQHHTTLMHGNLECSEEHN